MTSTSSFEILSGPNGGPCPTGAAPFEPGFEAGTLNNQAGAHSPFAMRITRGDGMQDLTKFSAVLPGGVVGKIAGIPPCPEAGIAQGGSRTGEHGGTMELADPSCPAASIVGHTTAGAGVGSQLTYVPGTVVVRVGLRLNSVTGVVEADRAASDPIPHILQGIPLNVRDLRVYTNRPQFTLNATSCEPSGTASTRCGEASARPSRASPTCRYRASSSTCRAARRA